MFDPTVKSQNRLFADVSGLLRPASIAVIGASDHAGNLGGVAVGNLQKFGFPGPVWPVHPRGGFVRDLPAYRSVHDLPHVPDLAIVAISAASAPAALVELGRMGTRNAIVWAGGFEESGEEGKQLQRELVDAAAAFDIRMLGPNCLGVFSSELPLAASFASFLGEIDSLIPGGISIVGQSGGTVTNAVAHLRDAGFGFRFAVSTGNEAVVGASDFISALVDDPGTHVIAAYIEGTRDGAKLSTALAKARDAGKPVVVLRGGVSAAAARAAAAHTGALAGEARVWQAVLAELGVMEAHSLEELLDLVKQISSAPDRIQMRGNGLAIVTFGGGAGVLSADQAARRGLAVPPLPDHVRQQLTPLIPPIASAVNPIDLTPQTYQVEKWLETLPIALDLIAASPGIDAVLLQYGPMAVRSTEVAQITKDFMDRTHVPTVLGWELPPREVPPWLTNHGVHRFIEYDRAIRVLSHYARWSSVGAPPEKTEDALDFDWSAHVPHVVPPIVISEYSCHRLLADAGLSVAAGRLVHTPEEAGEAGAEVGWPVAVKGLSQAITHRFAAGLIELGVGSAEEAGDAAERILARTAAMGVNSEGIYVQRMETGEAEILVSALRDPAFGVIVTVGAGGVMTEAIDDVVLHRAPFDRTVAESMLRRLRVIDRLERNDTAPDLAPLVEFVSLFSRLSASAPWKSFVLEVNPVKWSAAGATAVDGLLIVEEQ